MEKEMHEEEFESNNYKVKSVDLAFDILFKISESQSLTLNQISKIFKINEKKVKKILETLLNRGYLSYNKKSDSYSLGIKNFEIGQSYLDSLDLRKLAKGYLKYLSEKFRETVYLAVRSNFEIVYMDSYEINRTVSVKSRLGKLLPMYASASGKVHLADMSQAELEEFFKEVELKKFTPKTITDKEELLKHIEEVKKNGYAIDDEEWEEEVRCLSVPVRNYKNNVVAAITISAPSFRVSKEKLINEVKDEMIKKAEELSRELGYNS
jgi:DNA-binding IclR family transcriptional regulator